MRLCTAKYEVYMQRIFYLIGESIGYHPWRYILGLLCITAVSSLGFLRFHQINNARITFTAHDSPSHTEGRMLEEFLRQNGSLHMIEMLVHAKDGGSLLRTPQRQQLFYLTHEIADDIVVQDAHGRNLTYGEELCKPYCQKNDAFYALQNWLSVQDGDDGADPNNQSAMVELTYPTMDILGKPVFIAGNVYDVTLETNTSNIIAFNTVILRYYMTHSKMKPMLDFEAKLVHLLYETHKYPLLKLGAASDNLVAMEVKAIGTKTAPLLSVALVVLSMFLVVSSVRYKRSESKPLEALLGALIPVLSGLTTIGMVSATGLAFQSIVVSTLFLVLAIGIDDVFIILSAWHRTDRNMEVPQRLAETVQEAGCSMTVTSVTNLISFANGVLSTTPVLQTFAIYSSVASVVCYIYQLVIFPAILAITASNEYKKNEPETKCCVPKEIKIVASLSWLHDVVWKSLAEIVCKPWMRVFTISVLIGYWYLAVYGVTTMETDLAIQKMAPPEARIAQFKVDYDHAIKTMQTVAVLVKNPGDLRDPRRLQTVRDLIREFETAVHSYGKASTFAWIEPYFEFLSFYHADEDNDAKKMNFSYTDVPMFAESETEYKPTMRINEAACERNEPECVSSFLFTTGFTDVAKYNEMYPLLQVWRAIAARYPQFEVYAYTERSNFADQTNDMVSAIWQTVFSEVVCMGLSFVIFVPDVVSIVAAVFALLSVNMGVFGFLSLWGVGMDPVSLAALLMSIGFSVDIGAHISYHYYQVKAPTPREKLQDAFLHIGWPTMQGGLSTMLAMMPILVHPSYLGMVFLKTIILVSIFGLTHGLIVLPVFLSMFTTLFDMCRGKKSEVAPESDECSESTSCGDSHKAQRISPYRASIPSLGIVEKL